MHSQAEPGNEKLKLICFSPNFHGELFFAVTFPGYLWEFIDCEFSRGFDYLLLFVSK